MEQCHTLKEYAQYVTRVRSYAKEMKLDEAVERAVNECIQEGILSEFLRRNKARIIAMSIFEYDKEKEERKLREAEYEGGYDSGYNSGYDSGYNSGYNSGFEEGGEIKTEAIIRLMLDAKASLEMIKRYTGCTDEKIQEIKNRG